MISSKSLSACLSRVSFSERGNAEGEIDETRIR